MRAARGLEDEAVRRAREGVRKLVFYKGAPVYVHGEPLYETEFSDRLLERLLEANNPQKFKRQCATTLKRSGDLTELDDSQLEVLELSLVSALRGPTPAGHRDHRAEVIETRSAD
jgi:hypothetical protein